MGRKKRTKVNEEEAPPPTVIPNVVPTFAPPPTMPQPPANVNVPPPIMPPPADPRIKQESTSSIQIKSATIKKVVELGEFCALFGC